MSDLATFADHARRMAAADHKPECHGHARTRQRWAQLELESAPGARPRHWYVSVEAVPVAYDPAVVSARAEV